MHRRLAVDALIGIAAAVDADVDPGLFERPIADSFPDLPDRLDLARPCLEIVELAGLGAEAFGADPPRRHQQMRVIIPLIAVAVGGMNREVDGDAVPLDKGCGKFARSLDPLLVA